MTAPFILVTDQPGLGKKKYTVNFLYYIYIADITKSYKLNTIIIMHTTMTNNNEKETMA